MTSTVVDLRFTGDFSLALSVSTATKAAFVDDVPGDPNELDVVFPLEGSWNAVALRVEQCEGGGPVRVHVLADPAGSTRSDVRAQVERILSLDTDGAGLDEVAEHDKIVAGLQQRFRGLRPVLFHSPYEAAARAIIGHRLPVRQAASLTARVAAERGTAIAVGDRVVHAFPAPGRLADLAAVDGLSERKTEQLRALGAATADGRLDTARLRAMGRADAMEHLQQLPGIGPFSAELILLRGVGDPDVFPRTEMRLHRAMAAAYDLGDDPDVATLEAIAEQWRPYRSWVGLMLRHT